MSTDIESDLRAAFEQASEALTPRPDLTGLVRRAARRRRRRLAVAALLAATVVAGGGYAAVTWGPAGHRPGPGAPNHHGGRWARQLVTISLPPGAGAEELAAAGRFLYVAASNGGDRPYTLAAYDRVTGRLVRRVGVPAEPSALRAGPGGSVWLAFYANQNGGPSGIWLLNADLSRRSDWNRSAVADFLPTGPRTALLPTQYGLTELRMPPPGTPGRAVVSADRAGKVDGRFAISRLAAAGGTVAALVTNGYGLGAHLVIAGEPTVSYGGGASALIGSVAAEDGGFWASITAQRAPYTGPLIRLSPGLRVRTPSAVGGDRVLRRVANVWSAGHTVWVSSSAPGHPLVCFAYRGTAGPLRTVPVPGQPVLLAAAGRAVYVSLGIGDPRLRGYAVPAACR
jgi:hypothetical protein